MKRNKLDELGLERLSSEDMKTIIGGAVVYGDTIYEPQLATMCTATDGGGDGEDPKNDPDPDPAGF